MAQLKSFSSCLSNEDLLAELRTALNEIRQDCPAYIEILNNHDELRPAYERAQELKSKFDEMVVVGIGGSHLGAESFLKALSFPRNVIFMENPDPVGIARRFSALKDVNKTHFVFVSKSGSTYETLAISNWILDQLLQLDLKLSEHCTVISVDGESSVLRRWAQSQNVTCIDMREDLSGRYSVLSPSGLLPLYFSLDISLEAPFKEAILAVEDEESLLRYASLLYVSIQKQYRVLNFWSYADQMRTFSKWWRQLWSESLGHKLPGEISQVPICVLCRGASDQHSYLQQVIDQRQSQLNLILTVKNTPKEFKHLKVSKDHFKSSWGLDENHMEDIFKREAHALIQTFSDLDIPYLHLELDDISLESLSYFVIFQQLAVALLGKALKIDPYTQPAVEEMKIRVKQLSGSANRLND